MKYLIPFFVGLAMTSYGQWTENSTPNYLELIEECKKLAQNDERIELYQMGDADYGLPIYTLIVNGAQDSLKTFEKARNSTTILVNNAIHPGEPDGVNAMLIWLKNYTSSTALNVQVPVVAFIPAYNVGGMMNRSGTSRANQNGPEEYGFRGNAQNLDLNRDFIKMDSKNAFTFAKIYQALDPDVFIDNHVTNGADYQYVMTLISALNHRLSPSMKEATYNKMVPELNRRMTQLGFPISPYVDMIASTPHLGLRSFNDLPRYAMGYASLFSSFSFTVETHMLKPFPQRVEATLKFFEEMLMYCQRNHKEIEKARNSSKEYYKTMSQFEHHFELDTNKHSEIEFLGFEAKYKKSEVTGLDRLYYDRNAPFKKKIPFYDTYKTQKSNPVPKFYIVERQAANIIERLEANEVEMEVLQKDSVFTVKGQKIVDFKSLSRPYENHFLHTDATVELIETTKSFKKGDVLIKVDQERAFFIHSVLQAEAEDSYFSWNFMDSYLDQKEYFSPYVFEEIAEKILKQDESLKKEFETKQAAEPEFAKNQWAQLFYIYQRSNYYESKTHKILPIYLHF